MAIALMGAGFSATDTSDAVNILYPITMTVQANKAWQASGLKKSFFRHCCKVSDEAAFCLIQRPYISKTLLTRRISPRGSP
ncbi:hypothetical protein B9N07_26325 [Escherichia coli]|nr:hypothetical protein B9N07_26325 [Escherichia coli]